MAERRTSSPRAHARADRARGRGAKAPTGGRAARTGDRRGDLGPHLVATRPERTTLLGRRLEQNPLITARDVKPSHPDLEVVSVFNAATAQVDGQTVLLMRVAERPRTDIDPPDNAQTLDLDGPHPVLRPLPRGYSKHDVIGMCYLDTERDPARVVVAYIPKNLPGLDLRDPRSIRYRNSTGVLRMINDGYTDDLVTWGGHETVCLPRWERWDELRTGASAVPFRTKQGWLELYHGVNRHHRYAMGAVLLDGTDPRKVLARSPEPILAPGTAYERLGLFNDTIFSCGVVPLDRARIRMYYGAADSVVAAADVGVNEILASLEEYRHA